MVIFPIASEQGVLLIVEAACYTSPYVHIFITSSSHLRILSSSHLHRTFITPSSHFLMFSSSHLLIFTLSPSLSLFSSSHLLIFITSSHLLIFTSSLSLSPSLSLFLSPCPLSRSLSFFFSSLFRPRAVPTRRHKMATLSHEMSMIMGQLMFLKLGKYSELVVSDMFDS